MPTEFFDLYQQINGVGLTADDETDWWIVPLENIEENTEMLRDSHFNDDLSIELASRMFCFGDWFDGNCFGYVADESMSVVSTEIFEYDHGAGKIEAWGRTLGDFLTMDPSL